MKQAARRTGTKRNVTRWIVPLAFLLVMIFSLLLNMPFAHHEAYRSIFLGLIALGMLSTVIAF